MNRDSKRIGNGCGKHYIFALILLLSILSLLAISPQGRLSMTLPDQGYGHPWNGSDIMSYVEPAESFLKTGTFSRQGKADLHRTVGYPAFLALMMFLFDDHWLKAAYVAQLFIIALLFPCNLIVLRTLFPDSPKSVTIASFLLLALGVGTAYTGLLLSDQMFTSLLCAGMAFGFLGVCRKSWKCAFLHILFIGCAAQVRPTLGLFFICDAFLLLFVLKSWTGRVASKSIQIIIVCVLFTAVLGNAPALRNYIHHGVFTPTSIFSDNLARYLAGPVLIAQGKGSEYAVMLEQFRTAQGVQKIEIQKNFTREVILQYPVETFKRMIYHAVWNFFEPHWQYILNVFGNGFYLNHVFTTEGKINPKIYKGIPFWLFYGSLYLCVVSALYQWTRRKEWLLLAGVLLFCLPFGASFINGQGARMRLYAEPLFVDIAIIEIVRISAVFGNSRLSLRTTS